MSNTMAQCRVIFALMAKKTDYRTNPYVEIQIKEFYSPTKEDALKAAKMATRGKSPSGDRPEAAGFGAEP